MNNKLSKIILACAASLILSASDVDAQVALTPQQQDAVTSGAYSSGADLNQRVREYFKNMNKEQAETSYQENKEAEKAPTATEQKEVPEIKIFLKKMQFTDSEIIDRAVLDEIAAKYENREIVIGDLYKACGEVNAIYAKKGFLASKALIKAQKIDDGNVVITLVEGRVSQYGVKGNKATKSRYIERYFDINKGEFPNFTEIHKDIQLFNNTNTTKLVVKMMPGKEPRTTDLYIVAAEPEKKEKLSVFSDNSGRESSGEWRYGINFSNSNMCGYCDTLNLAAVFARTSETAMLNYAFHTDNKGNKLALNYSKNSMRISKGAIKDLDVRGGSEVAGVTYSHPVKTTNTRKQVVSLGYGAQDSETKVLGTRFVHDYSNKLTMAYDNLLIRKTDLFYYRPAYTYTDYRGMGNNQCANKLNLDMFWQKFKKNTDSMTLQFSGQKSFDDDICSSDRFYIGGVYSVRGYDESLLWGDSGFNLKFDYSWHTNTKGLRFITFADYARISGKNVPNTKNLSSVGLGFEYKRKQLSLLTTVGFALKDKVNGNDVDSSKVNVSVNYTF